MDKFLKIWDLISHVGVKNEYDYADKRRIILTNQIAILAVIIPQLYNLFYYFHDFELLKGPIVVNIAGSLISATVLLLNSHSYHKLAKIIISVVPNIQIYILTYYLSTASGMHLLHIMMISFVLFLYSNETKRMIIINALIPVIFYITSFFLFTPEQSPIVLDADVLQILFILISLTVFALVVVFFALFYREISYTEKLLENEYERSEKLLLNILPDDVIRRLKDNPGTIAEMYPSVTILFADIVGFTEIASKVEPSKLVDALNTIFSKMDILVDRYGLEKIKTIGDAYMVAGGIPVPMQDHTRAMALLALDMLEEIKNHKPFGEPLNIRIGFHTGPVVAGVIGMRKFSYDIWGDAVNMASRLESHGESGCIHVSSQVYSVLRDDFVFTSRGPVHIKGLGKIETYFLNYLA